MYCLDTHYDSIVIELSNNCFWSELCGSKLGYMCIKHLNSFFIIDFSLLNNNNIYAEDIFVSAYSTYVKSSHSRSLFLLT